MIWWYSSLATIVLPSGDTNASSAANGKPDGRPPGPGNCQNTRPALVTARMPPLPRSAISRPCGNGPLDAATAEALAAGDALGAADSPGATLPEAAARAAAL